MSTSTTPPSFPTEGIGQSGGSTARSADACIEEISVAAFKIPTDAPESDGTIAWDSTTLVLVEARAAGVVGIGYTYAHTAAANLISTLLASVVRGGDAMDVPSSYHAMDHAIRNLGRPGICSMAMSAVDCALWDLKSRLLDVPLGMLLGRARKSVPIYGSGGFTSYSISRLQQQLSGWVEAGIPRVKMKIGTHPEDDLARVRAARQAIGPSAELYVDANGAYTRKQALAQAERFTQLGVVWFEEPVTSNDLVGLRLMRDRAPAGMNVAAGEYGYQLSYFRNMLEAEAVDVLQADATRCGGITGFLATAPLVESRTMNLSAHCAPSLHVAPCAAIQAFWPIEYFYDHARIEQMLFDGAPRPASGSLSSDLSRPGLGLDFKWADAEQYRVA